MAVRENPRWLADSWSSYVGRMLAPQDFADTGGVVDLMSIGSTDTQLFKTEFTVAPDTNGLVVIEIHKSANNLVVIPNGVATFQGLLYYSGGPNTAKFDVYKWTGTDAIVSSFRAVGISLRVTFEGDTLTDGGALAVSSFPPYSATATPTPPATYDEVAGYSDSYTGAARDGCYQPMIPFSRKFSEEQSWDSNPDTTSEFITFVASGINVTGVYPNNLPRFRVVVNTLFELYSVTPYLVGSSHGGVASIPHPMGAPVGAHVARKLVKHKKHNGDATHDLTKMLEGGASYLWKNVGKDIYKEAKDSLPHAIKFISDMIF